MLATKKWVKNELCDYIDTHSLNHKSLWDSIHSLRFSLDNLVYTLGYDYDYPQTRPRLVKKGKKDKK